MAATTAATVAPTTGTAGGTGTTGSAYVRLTQLLNASVNTKDNTTAGKVTGVLVEHPPVPAAETTPAAGATATPAPTLPASQQALTVRYVMVSTTGAAAGTSSSTSSGNVVVVPWQAFNFTQASSVPAGGAMTANLNVTGAVLQAAPHTSLTELSSGNPTWAGSNTSYWTNQGLTIPQTGSTANANDYGANMFMIPSSRAGINIADANHNALGATADVFIDAVSGQIAYAVFNGGSTFNNKDFVVPMTNINWDAAGNAASITNRGELTLNIPNNILQNAPNLGSLSSLQLDPNTLNLLNQFWKSVQGTK